jgi:hypothetical protein
MAIANNVKEAQRIATQNTNKKKKLERSLIIDLRAFFRDIAEEFQAEYIRTSTIISLLPFLSDMTGILRKAYRRTIRRFTNNIREDIDIEIPDEINDEIERLNSEYVQTHSIDQARIIVNTTETQLENSVIRTVGAAAGAGIILNNRQIARQSSRDFINRSIPRSNTIAATEIQNASGQAKYNESFTFKNRELTLVGTTLIAPLKRRWVTEGDEKVRMSHVFADGQTVEMDGIFIVQGQRLRFPGDTALGATSDNVVNCRCDDVTVNF